jgi:adenylate kinase family enzyme
MISGALSVKRIVILGRSGSGKSTLARSLGERLQLPVIHLDAIFYRPDWQPSDESTFKAKVAAAIAGDRWITDGNFVSATAELRFSRASTIIWIDQPRWLCLARSITRCLVECNRGRPDLAEGCHDGIDWALIWDIWSFDRFHRPMIDAALRRWAPDMSIVRLNGDGAVAAYLESI